MYLYIFDQGGCIQSAMPPTSEDYKAIEDGTRIVIRFNGNLFRFQKLVLNPQFF